MKFNKTVLPSGLRVITVPMPDNPAVAILVMVEAGSKYEDKKNNVPCNSEDPSQAGAAIQGRALLDLQVDPLFKGQATSSCELLGTFDAAIRYNVVGADLYLENSQIGVTAATKSLPLYQVNAALSRFRAVRIDGKHGSYAWDPDFSQPLDTCRKVIAHQNEIK